MDKLPLNVNSDNLTFSDDLYKEEQASATLNFIDLGMTVDPPNKPSNGVVQQNGMQNNTKEWSIHREQKYNKNKTQTFRECILYT